MFFFLLWFQNCDRNVEDWQRILRVRSLVLTDQENKHTLIKFASLCRKSNRLVSACACSDVQYWPKKSNPMNIIALPGATQP